MMIKRALIFDCDGVLADTELNGHLVAFNQMWKSLGVRWGWSKEQYGEKLKIGGGKERMASLFNDDDFCNAFDVPLTAAERQELIATWHKEKTRLYEQIIASGKVPPRPGVHRLSRAALESGWRLAVASTSSPSAVAAVLESAVGDMARSFTIVAGDVVKAKKPAPDIYNLAVSTLGALPQHCVAIEDSRNGLLAADSANIPVVITVSEYTATEDFSEARLVVNTLGDPGGSKTAVMANRTGREIGDYISLQDLEFIISQGRS